MRRCRGEDGVYLVLYALLSVALFTMAAIALDISAFRQDRRLDRLVTDLAATAGTGVLDPREPASAVAACTTAWSYVEANLPAVAAAPDPACTSFPLACDPAVPVTAATTIGDYQIAITHPVPDADPLMRAETTRGDRAQAVVPTTDGTPCERLAVRIVRARQARFGQVAGFSGGSTDVHSVARSARSNEGGTVPGVLSLATTGCEVLLTESSLNMRVGGAASGVVWLDSDAANCAATDYLIEPAAPARLDVVGPGGTPGVLLSYAASLGRAGKVFDQSTGRVTPNPTAVNRRAGRAIFDERYNCRVVACAPNSPTIDQLRAALGGPVPPLDYVAFPDCTGATAPAFGVDYRLTCATVSGSLTFTGNVVIDGSLEIGANGCLAINSSGCNALVSPLDREVVVFQRTGNLVKSPLGSMHLRRATVVTPGSVVADRGPGALTWTAPTGGPLEDLLLWGESTAGHRIGEQAAAFTLEGALFAPNGTITMLSQNPVVTIRAQLAAARIDAKGNGVLVVDPPTNRATGDPRRAVRLIR